MQTHAVEWGGDPDNLVIMGHSAGGHLVALVSADSDRYPDLRPWRGTVVLDSAALDLVARMESRPPPLFRRAFGNDPALLGKAFRPARAASIHRAAPACLRKPPQRLVPTGAGVRYRRIIVRYRGARAAAKA